MKHFILIFTFLFSLFPNLLLAQENFIDSLKQALKLSNNDLDRCKIISLLTEKASEEEWPLYNEKLFMLAEKNSKIKSNSQRIFLKYLCLSINNKAILAQDTGNLFGALNLLKSNLVNVKKINDKEGEAVGNINIGEVYYEKGDLKTAMIFYKSGLKIFEQISNSESIASVSQKIGDVYVKEADIKSAIWFYEKALKIQEKLNDKRGIAATINNIAIIYINQNELKPAEELFNKSLLHYIDLKNKSGIATTLSNLGQIYQRQNNITKARENYLESLKIFTEIDDRSSMAICLKNIGSIYESEKKYELAIESYHKSMQVFNLLQKIRQTALLNYLIGKIYLHQNLNTKALEFALKSEKIADEYGFPEDIKNSSFLLYKIYKELHSDKLALKNYEIYILMRDSLSNQETKKVSIKSQLKYEYEKKAAADSVKVAEERKISQLKLKQEKTQKQYLYLGLKELVDEKQREILDSIKYAKRIQTALLPTKQYIKNKLQ